VPPQSEAGAVTATAGIIILVSNSIFCVSPIKENISTQAALQREEEARNQALDALNQAELSKQEADIARVEAEEAQLIAECAQKKAERESENTRAALKREQEAHYAANLMAADSYIRSGSFDDAEQRLDACNPNLRGWEWQHLKMRADPSFATIQLDSIPTQLTLSSDGSRVLWLSEEENEIQAADIRTRKLIPFPDSMTRQLAVPSFRKREYGGGIMVQYSITLSIHGEM